MGKWEIKFRKSFKKDYEKLGRKQKDSWARVFKIFRWNVFDKRLRRHKLKGKYKDFESIDICSDLRLLFRFEGNIFEFWYIRNHNRLYN